MVKLSVKYLIRRNKANKYFLTRKKGDTDEEFLKRITHLPLQNQFVEQILKMDNCMNVKVLYLQNNLLKNIENMENFPNLTHLYLQRNFLVKIENINVLKKLKKIYLGHNEIQVLEGMDKLKLIKEIHLESQDLSPGETIYFEPLTIKNLGETLQVLNISNNYLTSLGGLKCLYSLRVLYARDNYLCDLEDLTSTISGWEFLQELNLIGNYLTKDKHYMKAVVIASKNLEILDDSPIHSNTRTYIETLSERIKRFESKNKMDETKDKSKVLKFADEVYTKENFEFINPFPERNSVFLHPPWILRKNINSTNPKKFLPRPYWRKGGFQEKKFDDSNTSVRFE